MRLTKSTVTEITFMESVSDSDDIRALKLRLDGEGAGRYLILSNDRDTEIYITPEDLDELAKAAHQLWSQGDIYYPGEAMGDIKEPPMIRSPILRAPRETVTVLGQPVDAATLLDKLTADIAGLSLAMERIRSLIVEAYSQADTGDCDRVKRVLGRMERTLDDTGGQ